MNLLDAEELARLLPAEEHAYASPIPTLSVSSDEFMPGPQTTAQRRVEARIKELGGDIARKHGMTRRRFLQTASGMAAAFVAMNEVYGRLFDASLAEAQTPDMAKERAAALSRQFVRHGSSRRGQGRIREGRAGADQPPLRLRPQGLTGR